MKYEKESGIVRDAKGEIVARVSGLDNGEKVIDFARPVTAAELEAVYSAVFKGV